MTLDRVPLKYAAVQLKAFPRARVSLLAGVVVEHVFRPTHDDLTGGAEVTTSTSFEVRGDASWTQAIKLISYTGKKRLRELLQCREPPSYPSNRQLVRVVYLEEKRREIRVVVPLAREHKPEVGASTTFTPEPRFEDVHVGLFAITWWATNGWNHPCVQLNLVVVGKTLPAYRDCPCQRRKRPCQSSVTGRKLNLRSPYIERQLWAGAKYLPHFIRHNSCCKSDCYTFFYKHRLHVPDGMLYPFLYVALDRAGCRLPTKESQSAWTARFQVGTYRMLYFMEP